jgi:hypothetical protein
MSVKRGQHENGNASLTATQKSERSTTSQIFVHTASVSTPIPRNVSHSISATAVGVSVGAETDSHADDAVGLSANPEICQEGLQRTQRLFGARVLVGGLHLLVVDRRVREVDEGVLTRRLVARVDVPATARPRVAESAAATACVCEQLSCTKPRSECMHAHSSPPPSRTYFSDENRAKPRRWM